MMTRAIVRLHRRLWPRSVGESPTLIVFMILVVINTVGAGIGGAALIAFGLSGAEEEIGVWVIPLLYALGTVAYLFIYIGLPSGEVTITPSSLAQFPVTYKDVRRGLIYSGLLQSRPLLAILVASGIGIVILFTGPSIWVGIAGIICSFIACATALIIGQLVSLSMPDRPKSSAAKASFMGALVYIIVFLGVITVPYWWQYLPPFDLMGEILAWTPIGASGGVIAALAAGRWWVAGVQALIMVATLLAAIWGWGQVVHFRLNHPILSGSTQTKEEAFRTKKTAENNDGKQILLPGLPFTPFWAIFSRTIRYARHDGRVLNNLVLIFFFMVVLVFQGSFFESGVPVEMFILFGALLMLVLGPNDFGYDGPSGWTVLVSGIPAKTALMARHIANYVLIFPPLLVLVLGSAWLSQNWIVPVLVVGGSMTGAAIALILTTFMPYPVMSPDSNIWSGRSSMTANSMLSGFVALLGAGILMGPFVILAFIGGTYAIVGAFLGLVVPGISYAVIIYVCCRVIDKRWSRNFQLVREWA